MLSVDVVWVSGIGWIVSHGQIRWRSLAKLVVGVVFCDCWSGECVECEFLN